MMSNFIERLPLTASKDQINKDLSDILCTTSWEPRNQIGLRHRPGCQDQWTDGYGSLFDRTTGTRLSKEDDFSEWNDSIPEYTKNALVLLADHEKVRFGRIRFMRLLPKTGLSIHVDEQVRYHFVLETHKDAIFCECFEDSPVRTIGYNIPADEHWYRIDTRRSHFVYNGGWLPRIHLVVCPI
jgi:hypothetical protein